MGYGGGAWASRPGWRTSSSCAAGAGGASGLAFFLWWDVFGATVRLFAVDTPSEAMNRVLAKGMLVADGDAFRAQRIRGAFHSHGNGEDVKLDCKGVPRRTASWLRAPLFLTILNVGTPQLRAPRRDHGPERA